MATRIGQVGRKIGHTIRRHKVLASAVVGAAALSPMGRRLVKSGLKRWHGTNMTNFHMARQANRIRGRWSGAVVKRAAMGPARKVRFKVPKGPF